MSCMDVYTFLYSLLLYFLTFSHQSKLISTRVINVQSLELEKCGVQLEQCQLVRYNEKSGTLGKPFDEPKVSADCCVCVFVCVCDM